MEKLTTTFFILSIFFLILCIFTVGYEFQKIFIALSLINIVLLVISILIDVWKD